MTARSGAAAVAVAVREGEARIGMGRESGREGSGPMRAWGITVPVAVACMTAVASRAEEQHPRLMATPEVIARVRKLATVKGSHHEQALAAIRERVKIPLELSGAYPPVMPDAVEAVPPPPAAPAAPKPAPAPAARKPDLLEELSKASPTDADTLALPGIARTPRGAPPAAPAPPRPDAKLYSRRAAELAFLSLFSAEEAERVRLAADAAALLEATFNLGRGSNLALAAVSVAAGEAYDWAYPALPEAKRASLRAGLLRTLDAWPQAARYWKGANKQAVERGAEITLMLALCEEKTRAERYARLKEELIKNYFEIEYSDLGVSQEGLAYTEYPSQFYWPAVHSARSVGDEDFFRAACRHASWKLGMYTHNFMPHARKFVQFGVDWSSNFDEGWASGLLPTAPAEQMPYVLWWYDRHMGRKAPGELIQRFDCSHGGNFMSVLLYPGGVEPKDPTGVFPPMINDDQGRFFFRNRWQDANDLQVTFAADAHDIPCGWDAPICFAFNLMGYDTRFFGGPCKGGGPGDYSKLMIDGKAGSAKKTGKVIAFEASKDGGYVLAEGGEQYAELGCTSARRHFLVKFLPGNAALVATLDQVVCGKSCAITWQGNVGAGHEEPASHGVTVEAAERGFLLKGRAGGAVRGWVLAPSPARIAAADPVQVGVAGDRAEIMVVMWIGAGAPPAGTVSGGGLDAALAVGGVKVRFDAGSNRLRAE